MDQIERWKQTLLDNTHQAELLESGKLQAFSGRRSDDLSNGSASMAAHLRHVNASLQMLIDRHEAARTL